MFGLQQPHVVQPHERAHANAAQLIGTSLLMAAKLGRLISELSDDAAKLTLHSPHTGSGCTRDVLEIASCLHATACESDMEQAMAVAMKILLPSTCINVEDVWEMVLPILESEVMGIVGQRFCVRTARRVIDTFAINWGKLLQRNLLSNSSGMFVPSLSQGGKSMYPPAASDSDAAVGGLQDLFRFRDLAALSKQLAALQAQHLSPDEQSLALAEVVAAASRAADTSVSDVERAAILKDICFTDRMVWRSQLVLDDSLKPRFDRRFTSPIELKVS